MGVLTTVGLLAVSFFPMWWTLGSVFTVWALAIFLVHYFVYSFPEKWEELLLALWFGLSSLALMSILDFVLFRYIVAVVCGIGMGMLFHTDGKTLSVHRFKPRRRMLMMLWMFSAYALSSFVFALAMFFQGFWFWLASILLALFYGCAFMVIWRMYFAVEYKNLFLWSLLSSCMLWELIWVVHLLPYGYLVSGFFVVWVAYIIQLFLRFHLSKVGLVWKKQLPFLITNAILYILVLVFFVRWV